MKHALDILIFSAIFPIVIPFYLLLYIGRRGISLVRYIHEDFKNVGKDDRPT